MTTCLGGVGARLRCQIESTLEDTTLEKKFGHGNQPITKQVHGLF